MPEDAITSSNKSYVFTLAFVVALGVAGAVAFVAEGRPVLCAVFGLVAVVSGWMLSDACYRVDLQSDGTLVLHYVWGRRLVDGSTVTSIRSVEAFSEGEGQRFVVKLPGRVFRLGANDSTERLIDALVRLSPDATLTGSGFTREAPPD